MKRVNIIGMNGKKVTLITPDREDVAKTGWLPNTVAFPVFFNTDHADLLDQMTRTVKGGEGSGNFDHAGRPGERGGSAPASAHPGKVWHGKQHEDEPTLNKLETGSIGEHAVIDALSQLYGVEFGTVNVNVNNAPFDVAGDSLAVEVKTGLATNGSGAHHWRATIGQPGKAETELLKQMSPEEKRAHNERKTQAILERKYGLLKKMSDEAGHPIKPMTVGLILRGDGKAADIYTFEGFHLRLPWSKYATDDYYLGTYDVENKVMHWKDAPTKAAQFEESLPNLHADEQPATEQPQSDLLDRALAAALAEIDKDFEQVYQWWREHVDSSAGTIKGGRGSGNFGHHGRPGERGGSAASDMLYAQMRKPKVTPTAKTPAAPPKPNSMFAYLDANRLPTLNAWRSKRSLFLAEAMQLPSVENAAYAYKDALKLHLKDKADPQLEAALKKAAVELRSAEEKERALFIKHFGTPGISMERAQIAYAEGDAKVAEAAMKQADDFLNQLGVSWPDNLVTNLHLTKNNARTGARPAVKKIESSLYMNARTLLHEQGHLLEYWGKDKDGVSLKEAARSFLDARTAGQKAVPLNGIESKLGFSSLEKTKPDHFFDSYVGLQYSSGDTEVISMGLEALYEQSTTFARKDPEHFLFTILAVKGELR